jgi:hypothetical protein
MHCLMSFMPAHVCLLCTLYHVLDVNKTCSLACVHQTEPAQPVPFARAAVQGHPLLVAARPMLAPPLPLPLISLVSMHSCWVRGHLQKQLCYDCSYATTAKGGRHVFLRDSGDWLVGAAARAGGRETR